MSDLISRSVLIKKLEERIRTPRSTMEIKVCGGRITITCGYANIKPSKATTSTYKTINYGYTYPSAPYVFIALAGAPQIATLNLSVDSVSTSSFQAHIYASNTTERGFRWLAIGVSQPSDYLVNLT